MRFRPIDLILPILALCSSLYVFSVALGIVVFVGVVFLSLYVRWGDRYYRIGLVLLGILGLMLIPFLYKTYFVKVYDSSRYRACNNQLKNVALALHNYLQANGSFPPAYIADKNGRPMHSWRVLILPFIEGEELFKKYDFNEPWDGPNNKKLISAMPETYWCPNDKESAQSGCTNYLAVVGPHSVWRGEKAMKGENISSFSQTILLVEVADSNVVWTEPRDFDVDSFLSPNPPMKISSKHAPKKEFFFRTPSSGANIALGDGSIRFLPSEMLASDRLPDMLKIGGFTDSDWNATESRTPKIDWLDCFALVVWFLSVVWLQYRAFQLRQLEGETQNPPEAPARDD